MATYTVGPDEYAGWGSAGQYFAYFGLAAGLVGLTGWAAVHGHLAGWHPADAAGQLAAVVMEWVGGGLFGVMGLAALGSLILSGKARGTVTVDDVGVLRQIESGRVMLRWEEIEGYVAVASGVTLIPREGRARIVIPRFLDDFRGCMAELKARNLQSLPARRLLQRWRWKRTVQTYAFLFLYLLALEKETSHPVRVAALVGCAGVAIWELLLEDPALDEGEWLRWVNAAFLVAMLGWLGWHMTHTW